MTGFLSSVVAAKRADLAGLAGSVDRAALMALADARPVRDFSSALRAATEPGAIIAEFKRRSPSVAAFPGGVDPAATARLYAANGASALSVVTDETHFGTTLADATAARAACDLPLLVKDFVIDPLQALLARAAGADALLLIARSLSPGELTNLLCVFGELGLTALVECHDESDVSKALTAGAPVIGINSRDLETLDMNSTAHERLLPLLRGRALAVAESGLRTQADLQARADLGANAFLIGGALLQSEDPAALLRDLGGAS
jgi:indole-3-glycerol phosphate synthase